jgi:hypothetical protein
MTRYCRQSHTNNIVLTSCTAIVDGFLGLSQLFYSIDKHMCYRYIMTSITRRLDHQHICSLGKNLSRYGINFLNLVGISNGIGKTSSAT